VNSRVAQSGKFVEQEYDGSFNGTGTTTKPFDSFVELTQPKTQHRNNKIKNTKMKNEQFTIEQLEKQIAKTFKSLSQSLKLLYGSDFCGDDSGLNETGLKFGLLQPLQRNIVKKFKKKHNLEVKIRSEFEFAEENGKPRFSDIVILIEEMMVAVVIELKYKRVGFIANENIYKYKYGEGVTQSRDRLQSAATKLLDMSEQELLNIQFKQYYTSKSNDTPGSSARAKLTTSSHSSRKPTPSKVVVTCEPDKKRAEEQVDDAMMYLKNIKQYKKVMGYSLIAIGNRMMCYEHSEWETNLMNIE
jgi:hypothetical protein